VNDFIKFHEFYYDYESEKIFILKTRRIMGKDIQFLICLKKKALRRIFEPKRDEETKNIEKLHIVELHKLHCLIVR
jgi:hypothetical protein